MTRKALVWFTLPFVLFFSSTAWALPDADLNCDGEVDIVDVQLSILHALSIPMNPLLDSNGNAIPDACEPIAPTLVCGAGTEVDEQGEACVVSQFALDEAFAAGVASVDVTSDNDQVVGQGFIEGLLACLADGSGALSGVVLAGADLSGMNLSGLDFSGADLTGANLKDTNLSGTNLTGANLTDVQSGGIVGAPTLSAGWVFTAGHLVGLGANLVNADLTNSKLLVGLDLSGTDLTGANLTNVPLADTTLIGTSLSGVLLQNSILQGVNLTGADLSDAVFTNVPSQGANLTGVDMTNGIFTNMDLANANLTNANLAGATFPGCCQLNVILSNTICPDGTNSDDNGGTCF